MAPARGYRLRPHSGRMVIAAIVVAMIGVIWWAAASEPDVEDDLEVGECIEALPDLGGEFQGSIPQVISVGSIREIPCSDTNAALRVTSKTTGSCERRHPRSR